MKDEEYYEEEHPRQHKQGSNLAIPAAIVIAGLFIAGALVYTNKDSGPANPSTNTASTAEINLRPVSQNDHILGNPNADIVIVEYSDLECPFCKNFHTTLHQIIEKFGASGNVAWVYRHFPISELHSKAPREAEATECAWEQGDNDGFWKYINRVFEVTPSNDGLADSQLPAIAEELGLDRSQFEACLNGGSFSKKVASDYNDAVAAGGRGTPFSVIVSKKKLSQEALDFIASAQLQLPPETVDVSKDEKKVAVNGALPYSFFELLLNVMLGNETN